MSKKILIATRNQKKSIELQRILSDLNINILTLNEIDEIPEVIEDGSTFEENAIKKAKETSQITGFITLADDSGLVVDYLNGQPGIYSARFASENATDEQNNEKLLYLLKDTPDNKRTAKFVCVIAICTPDGKIYTTEGECRGTITRIPIGEGGFGYDPLFIPEGYNESFAQLQAHIKNNISHRGKAIKNAKPLIEDIFLKLN